MSSNDSGGAHVDGFMRIGIGYDLHRFEARRKPLKLGGVAIPSAKGLSGHSDADVLLHAIADALLGAIGAPDLGELFPPSNPKYKGMDSRQFVRHATRLVHRAGWRVGNVDTTVVADAPRLTRHKPKMRDAISRLLQVVPSAVSVKAKTTEGLPPGNRGIAVHAVVLLTSRSLRAPGPAMRLAMGGAGTPLGRTKKR